MKARQSQYPQEKRMQSINFINHVCYLIIAPRIKGMASI